MRDVVKNLVEHGIADNTTQMCADSFECPRLHDATLNIAHAFSGTSTSHTDRQPKGHIAEDA